MSTESTHGSRGPKMARRTFVRRAVATGAAVAAAGLLAACGGGGGSDNAGGATDEEFRVGAFKPTTGFLATAYAPLFIQLDMAVEEINADGGIDGRQVKVVEIDDQGSPTGQPAAVRKAQADKLSYVFGPIGDQVARAGNPLLSNAKILTAHWSQSEKNSNGDDVKYAFSAYMGIEPEAHAMAEYLVTEKGQKKIGYLKEGTSLGDDTEAPLKAKVEELGGEIVSTQTFPQDATSFVSYLTKLRDAGAEAIATNLTNPTNGIAFHKALQQLRWYPEIVSHFYFFKPVLESEIPDQIKEKLAVIQLKNYTFEPGGQPNERVNEYVNRLRKQPKFDESGLSSSPFYDMLYLLKQTIEQEKTFDADKIREALEKVSGYEGMNGTITFTPENRIGVAPEEVVVAGFPELDDPATNDGFFMPLLYAPPAQQ